MSGAGGRFGPYHHRDGLPSQGHLYDEHGHLIHPETPPNPNDDDVDYGRMHEGPVKPKKPKKPPKTDKRHRQGRRGGGKGMARRNRKPKPVLMKPTRNPAGKPTEAYPTASQATGGAMAVRELDALAEVGLTPILAELVNHGNVTLGHTLGAWQREQDRITNRTWRRPGGLQKPAGL